MAAYGCTGIPWCTELYETTWGLMVGLPGFEPGTSCTPSKRASQAAPRPDPYQCTLPPCPDPPQPQNLLHLHRLIRNPRLCQYKSIPDPRFRRDEGRLRTRRLDLLPQLIDKHP